MIYAGLVIGGPMNGARYARESQQATVQDVPYQFGPIYIDSNNELNVWTPVGQSRLQTLRLLIEGYRP